MGLLVGGGWAEVTGGCRGVWHTLEIYCFRGFENDPVSGAVVRCPYKRVYVGCILRLSA